MAEPISIQQLKDASEDVKSLEEVVNGDENVVVTTRLGETYPSVKGSIKKVFENGGLPATPFKTKALMTASALVDGDYAMVIDGGTDNGLYVKTAGVWVKSDYDPLTQAKTYADTNKADTLLRVQNVFATKALMTESALVDGSNAQVNNDTTADNNGFYKKTAGNWVKSDYSPLTANKVKVSPNLLDLNALESGKNINTSGVIYSAAAYSLSPYIAVEPNTAYEMTTMVSVVFYDASKTYLSGATTKVFTTPENTAFIRVSNHTANMPNNMLTTVADRPPVFVAFKEVDYLYDVPLDLPQLSKELSQTISVADVDENILPKIQNKVSTSVSNASFINRASNQLFDKTKITVGKRFGYGGSVSDSTTSNLTEYIAVKPNTVYSHAGEQGVIVEYDKDKLQTAWHVSGTASITTTATTAYVRIDVRTVALDNYVFFEGLPVLKPAYPDYAVYDLSPTIRATTTKSKWEGKKWNYMGDSIVAASGNYCSKIAASKRMKVARNYGIGGTAIEVRDAPYDLNAMCIRYVDMDLDADLITVSGGTNGVKSAEGLGSFDVRDNTTTYGAVRDLMEGLVDRYPEATIAFILPFHRGNSHTHNQLYADSGIFAHRKILIDCCIYYGIPYFDSMTMLPLRLYNDKARTLYSPDGLHPNDAGHQKAAEIIGKWLETI